MTTEATDLARRAVACPGWRWMGGARWIGVRSAPFENLCGRYPDSDRGYSIPHDAPLPDLTDPATLGCLLALVREAWVDADIFGLHYHCDGGWCVEVNDRHFYATTPAEALVAALEAAS